MYVVLSGEGNSDIGFCNNLQEICEGNDFYPRAMAIIIDQIICKWTNRNINYSHSFLEYQQVTYISEKTLAEKKLHKNKKISIPGKKTKKETGYFYNNARSLAVFAKKKQEELENNAKVIAILFRDNDGTASSGRGEYAHKRDSMKNGFEEEDFNYGVAMIPKPKSEAWLLCAVKENPYQGCNKLESASGNDNSPNCLKSQLSDALSSYSSQTCVEDLLNDNTIDIDRINMDSFINFRKDLEDILLKIY